MVKNHGFDQILEFKKELNLSAKDFLSVLRTNFKKFLGRYQ